MNDTDSIAIFEKDRIFISLRYYRVQSNFCYLFIGGRRFEAASASS